MNKSELQELSRYLKNNKPKYKFRALCTSDECRLVNRNSPNKTDVGIIKAVSKGVDWCPDCEYALFWERYLE